MAKKPFYSLEEVCEKLGKSEEDIKSLVREGELREFRDAGKVFFKSEDIDRMAGDDPADDEEIMLEAGAGDSDSDESDRPAQLTESSGGTSIIGLEPLDDEASSDDSGTTDEEEEQKEDTMITESGIGVFDDDELEIDADPMAKTQITTGADEDDQITLEGAGSGSGLLDLAREADDTALGADLLDEIIPGEEEPGEEPAAEAEPVAEAEPAEEEPEPEAEEEALPEEPEAGEPVAAPVPVAPRAAAAADPAEGMFSGMLVGALVLVTAGLIVVSGSLQDAVPGFAELLSNGTTFYFTLGGAVIVIVLGLLVGWFVGKAFAPRPRRA